MPFTEKLLGGPSQISEYGFEAGYNGAGSHISTATASEGFPNEHRNTWFRTLFSTALFRVGWFGGATMVHPKRASRARHRAPQEAGTHFDTSNEAAIQWSSGFDLEAGLGLKGANLKASFNGTAQTGYDKNALMHFQFHTTGLICGTNKRPSEAAILVMRG